MRHILVLGLFLFATLFASCKVRQESNLNVALVDDFTTFDSGLSVLMNHFQGSLILNDRGLPHYVDRALTILETIPNPETPFQMALVEYRLNPLKNYLQIFSQSSDHPLSGPENAVFAEITAQRSLVELIWANQAPSILQELATWNQMRRSNNQLPVLMANYKSSVTRKKTWAMVVPEKKGDLWLQFNRDLNETFVIYVEKSVPNPKVFFDMKSKTMKSSQTLMSNHCSTCHRSGYPFYISSPVESVENTQYKVMNEMIAGYDGIAEVVGVVPPPKDMPGLGIEGDFDINNLSTLLGNSDPLDQTVADDFNTVTKCLSCHNAEDRAKLTFPFGFFVDHSISEYHMPPDSMDIYQRNEKFKFRLNLKQLLLENYKVRISSWLNGEGLKPAQPTEEFVKKLKLKIEEDMRSPKQALVPDEESY